ncbi:hypothetical protein ACT7DC_02905 [Bacillus cereus]
MSMKLMEANAMEFQNMKIKPANYLIEKIAESQYLIHREIAEHETEVFQEEKLFEYEGKSFLPKIRSCSSEEQAELAVQSYWQGIKELNEPAILQYEIPDVYTQALSIAEKVVPRGQTKDPFWEDSARDLLVGILLYDTSPKKELICVELANVFSFIDTAMENEDFLQHLAEEIGSEHPSYYSFITTSRSRATRVGIVSTLRSAIHQMKFQNR